MLRWWSRRSLAPVDVMPLAVTADTVGAVVSPTACRISFIFWTASQVRSR